MFRILTIPFDPAGEIFDDEILRDFCLNKHVRSHKADLFHHSGKPYWTVMVEYEPGPDGKAEADMSGLDDREKLLFERLRTWRKEKAQGDGVPVYIVATNSQIRHIARSKPRSLEALKAVKGFGKSKVERHGGEILHLITAFLGEE